MKIAKNLIILFVSFPIWIYLQYKILTMIQATELMWFLFYIYVPTAFIAGFIGAVIDDD